MRDPLPIDAVLPELVAGLKTQASVLLRAPTGAGKTTRVPPALLDAELVPGRILVLEPRRLAARAAARRMAQERGQAVGAEVGYHVRFDRQASSRTRIMVMTPGILLRMLQEDSCLESTGVVIFDEFHERSLDNDLALGMVRLIQSSVRSELRIVVMSATLQTEAVAAYLGNCPVIDSQGRLHPVEIIHEPRSIQQPWPVAAARAIERTLDRTNGDILCFLPGMQEIRQTARELSEVARGDNLLVLPLHGDLSAEEQDRALLPQERRRVVLATNVAETSVTVEGITAVVDTGLARMQTFDASVGMDRLELTPIAQDAAEQRTGRAGRTSAGICVRLWSEASHQQRALQTLPEIRRVDLAGAVLQLLAAGESDVRSFPWLEPPSDAAIKQSLSLLQRLGAIESSVGQGGMRAAAPAILALTDLGRAMARLPVHPRLARMLLEGQRLGSSTRVALAAALLAERDPFQRAGRVEAGKRRARDGSDILAQLEALEGYEKTGSTSFAIGLLHEGAARFLLRARDQLLRSLEQECHTSPPHLPFSPTTDEVILRTLLTAFPDRVARQRETDPRKGLMVGGVGVRLAPWCASTESSLFLCIDVNAHPEETEVRQVSTIEREWLPDTRVTTRTEIFFDEKTERLAARKRVYYEDLLLEEKDAALPRSDEASSMLAEAARTRLPRVLPPEGSAAGSYLLRLRWLREWMPELNLPALDEAEMGELLPWACTECRSFEEVRRSDWLGLILGKLTPAQIQAIEREAPEHLQVPSGSRLKLTYEPGKVPVLAVRIQEVFGWSDTPRLAAGRVRVLLHLLAPSGRPQQVTDDLASFWKNTYALVRKELRIRYPKHAWPEDPLNALPQRAPKRR